jgi:hypothetical protein
MILTIKLFTFAFDYHDGWTAKKDGASADKIDDVRAQVTIDGICRLSLLICFAVQNQ